jgi:hypothetical protein
MAKNFHNGTNIVAKHTIYLGEEFLEFFMAPTSVLTQKIPAL